MSALREQSIFVSQIELAIQCVDRLNKKRVKQALSLNNEQFQHIFQLLPLLLHYNHPDLPGYIKNVPCGIWQFELSDYQQKYLEKNAITENVLIQSAPSFDGVYSMGSTGSIFQTALSDLDIWVCSDRNFNTKQKALINSRFHLLKEWANNFKVEVNFYLMNSRQFKNKYYYNNKITKDNSGSTQHFFLLDEFYRSAIRLTGKRLLWLHLLKRTNQTYQEAINQAVSEGLVLEDWIDFGDFSALSIDEFFGASLWQLYKSINSPYKSILKLLLLESYTTTYPETDLISKQFKKRLLNSEDESYHFDPYLAILEQITHYLVIKEDYFRLKYIQQYFYIKITSDKSISNERVKKLNELVSQWHWSSKQINDLSQRESWKIKQAMKHHQTLFNISLQSYHYFVGFVRKQNVVPCLLSQDSDVLIRQLYSIFELLPGKIPLLSNKIKWHLAEEALTFVEAQYGSFKGWYLLNHAPHIVYNPNNRYTQHFPNLIQLISWAYFNGLITVNTKIHLISKSIQLPKLYQFITDLRLHMPIKAPLPSSKAWYHPNEIRHLTVVINLSQDPTLHLDKIPQKLKLTDLFNFSSNKKKIIGSIALIYRNMWNEIRTECFDGDNAVLNALKLLSNKLYQNNFAPESLNVFCYSKYLNKEIQYLVRGVVNRCIVIQTGINYQNQLLMRSGISNRKWQFVFENSVFLPELKLKLPKKVTKLSSLVRHYSIPEEIGYFAIEGFIQFFFEDTCDNLFNVYILDEKNVLEYYLNCKGSKDKKVKLINTAYAEKKALHMSFCFPQFYQIIEDMGQKEIILFESFA